MQKSRPTLKDALAEINRQSLENLTDTALRELAVQSSKEFKLSWVHLGRVLYSVWKDKLFRAWGYEKFETYIAKEVGIRKATAVKLLRSYFFLEKEEPEYLKEEFSQEREAAQVPTYDAVNVLRLAREKKDLTPPDYMKLKKSVFESGKDATAVRKDLTSLIRQRQPMDPDEERQKRSEVVVRRLVNAFRSFKKDAQTLSLLPTHLIREAEELIQKIERATL